MKKTTYYPDSDAVETWSYKEATCYIVLHKELGHYCGYVRFKKNPFAKGTGCHYEGFRNYIPVHGGITYAKKDAKGYVYGFDCAHAGDEKRPELKDIAWLKKHTEQFCDMLILAKPYEQHYRRLLSNKAKAKVISAYIERVENLVDIEKFEQIGFGAMINLLSGKL